MNRDKRQFVHELSDHFGIESESYDAEPKRNVVATGNWFYSFFFDIYIFIGICFNDILVVVVVTAVKDRVWLPSQSILDVVQGLRKAPAPIAINPNPKP